MSSSSLPLNPPLLRKSGDGGLKARSIMARTILKSIDADLKKAFYEREFHKPQLIKGDVWKELEYDGNILAEQREMLGKRAKTWQGAWKASVSLYLLRQETGKYRERVSRKSMQVAQDEVQIVDCDDFSELDLADIEGLDELSGVIMSAYATRNIDEAMHRNVVGKIVNEIGIEDAILRSENRVQRAALEILQKAIDDIDDGHAQVDGCRHELESFRNDCASKLRTISHRTNILPRSLWLGSFVGPMEPIRFGGFSAVSQTTFKDQVVAFKTLLLDSEKSKAEQLKTAQRFRREAIIWRQMRHRNIHRLMGIGQDTEGHLGMVSAWCQYTLPMYLKHHGETCDRIFILQRIADAFCYMHGHNPALVHKDLKGDNILINDKGEPCLTDFGISTFANSFTVTKEAGSSGTDDYQAPELRKYKLDKQYIHCSEDEARRETTKACDMYAFAFVCLEVYVQKNLWPSFMPSGREILRGLRPERPSEPPLPDGVWSIIVQCWAQDPDKRMTCVEAYQALSDLMMKST